MPKSAQNATIYSILTKTLRYFAIVGDISRLIAISIAFYMPNATHAIFSVERIPTMRIYSILQKTVCYFAIVGDISTFKRYIHCILHAECYADRF